MNDSDRYVEINGLMVCRFWLELETPLDPDEWKKKRDQFRASPERFLHVFPWERYVDEA